MKYLHISVQERVTVVSVCLGESRVRLTCAFLSSVSCPLYLYLLTAASVEMLISSALGAEFVFSVMDFLIVLLIMIATVIWFRSKYVERFYDACKVNVQRYEWNGTIEDIKIPLLLL